jgi:iron complex transport system permease protein
MVYHQKAAGKWGSRMIKLIRKRWVLFLFIPLITFLIFFTIGKYPISISELLHTLFYHVVDPSAISDPKMETGLFNIQLPRVCMALLVGCGLSMAGAVYQGMFKNLLVPPDILGASAGAGFAAALALYFPCQWSWCRPLLLLMA